MPHSYANIQPHGDEDGDTDGYFYGDTNKVAHLYAHDDADLDSVVLTHLDPDTDLDSNGNS